MLMNLPSPYPIVYYGIFEKMYGTFLLINETKYKITDMYMMNLLWAKNYSLKYYLVKNKDDFHHCLRSVRKSLA